MDWGTAGVAIFVAFIAGPIGYFSARWRGRNDLAQWRRDRLLEFSSDLLASGGELIDKGWDIVEQGEDVPYPSETMRKVQHAVACISLLSSELRKPASDCAVAHAQVVKQAYDHAHDANLPGADFDAAATSAAGFARKAHRILVDIPESPTIGWLVWARVKRSRSYVSMLAAIVRSVTPAPPAPPGPPAAAPPSSPQN
jgi:hypothetical protein